MDDFRDFPGIISFPDIPTPLGRVCFGGRLSGTPGTGFSGFRRYGMYALVLLCGHGAGRYRDLRGSDRRISSGDLIVVFPDLPHQYGPEAGDIWDEIFISFEGPAFGAWILHGLDANQPVWQLPSSGGWLERFGRILKMPATNHVECCALASAMHLLIAQALAARPSETDVFSWLQPACQALAAGTGAPGLEEIASAAGLSYDTFRKNFKIATGESPSRYRRRVRLAQAEVMMRRNDVSLELIASALGFCDAFHLSKAFKKQYGQAPDHYRRS